jgi:hypothetical protein
VYITPPTAMKKIYINGYDYYHNTTNGKLFVDEAMTNEVAK